MMPPLAAWVDCCRSERLPSPSPLRPEAGGTAGAEEFPAGINVGLESFADSLREQGAQAVHVDWKPVAASSERLVGILDRMRQAK